MIPRRSTRLPYTRQTTEQLELAKKVADTDPMTMVIAALQAMQPGMMPRETALGLGCALASSDLLINDLLDAEDEIVKLEAKCDELLVLVRKAYPDKYPEMPGEAEKAAVEAGI